MSIEELKKKAVDGQVYQGPSAPVTYTFTDGHKRTFPEGIMWAESEEEAVELKAACKVRNIKVYTEPAKEVHLKIPPKVEPTPTANKSN